MAYQQLTVGNIDVATINRVPFTAGASYLPSTIYVSKNYGSDTTGTGAYGAPLASIGAAITLAGTPTNTNTCAIYIMDGAVYTEHITLPGNVSLYGPAATLTWGTASDHTLTITGDNNSGNNVVMGAISATGFAGNAIRVTAGYANVRCNVVPSHDVYNVGNGTLVFSVDTMPGSVVQSTGTGKIILLAANEPGGLSGSLFAPYYAGGGALPPSP